MGPNGRAIDENRYQALGEAMCGSRVGSPRSGLRFRAGVRSPDVPEWFAMPDIGSCGRLNRADAPAVHPSYIWEIATETWTKMVVMVSKLFCIKHPAFATSQKVPEAEQMAWMGDVRAHLPVPGRTRARAGTH